MKYDVAVDTEFVLREGSLRLPLRIGEVVKTTPLLFKWTFRSKGRLANFIPTCVTSSSLC